VTSGAIDILLTTYDKLRNEVDTLAAVGFHAVVADEVHKLKNQKSRVYEAAVQLPGVRRYGLTGTPMMNRWVGEGVGRGGGYRTKGHWA
jgi:SNF2 family DNA or RNA helicase